MAVRESLQSDSNRNFPAHEKTRIGSSHLPLAGFFRAWSNHEKQNKRQNQNIKKGPITQESFAASVSKHLLIAGEANPLIIDDQDRTKGCVSRPDCKGIAVLPLVLV